MLPILNTNLCNHILFDQLSSPLVNSSDADASKPSSFRLRTNAVGRGNRYNIIAALD